MSKQAILIDPIAKTITQITGPSDWREISKLIDCETFTCGVQETNEDDQTLTLYVDDNGLLKDKMVGGFTIEGYEAKFEGKGLVCLDSHDDQDEETHHDLTLEQFNQRIMSKISWLTPEQMEEHKVIALRSGPRLYML